MKKVLMVTIFSVALLVYVFFPKTSTSSKLTKLEHIAEVKREALTLEKVIKPVGLTTSRDRGLNDMPEKCQQAFSTLEEQVFYQELKQGDIDRSFACLKTHFLRGKTNHIKYLEGWCEKKQVEHSPSFCMEVMLGIKGIMLEKMIDGPIDATLLSTLSDQELMALFFAEEVKSNRSNNDTYRDHLPIYQELYRRFPDSYAVNQQLLHKTFNFGHDSQMGRLIKDYFDVNHPNDMGYLNASYYLTDDFSKRTQIFHRLKSLEQNTITTFYQSHALSIWQYKSKPEAIRFLQSTIDGLTGDDRGSQHNRQSLSNFLDQLKRGEFKKGTKIVGYYKTSFLDLL